MASGNRTKYPDKRARASDTDEPGTWEAQLAAERERNARRAPTTDDDVPDSGQEGVTRCTTTRF